MDHVVNDLSIVGATVKPISLNGRFHSTAHADAITALQKLCDSDETLRFPATCFPLVPLRSNSDGHLISEGPLHDLAIRSLLAERSDWHTTLTNAAASLPSGETHQALGIGLVECIPRSLAKASNLQITSLRGSKAASIDSSSSPGTEPYRYPDHAIAVVGMGCRFPGAESLDEFWDVIKSGSSMLGELPSGRFSTERLRRCADPNYVFRGNFLRDADSFDHRFFKKSFREAASMDPQHRLVLQVTYETLESAGYFQKDNPPTDVGCYMGVAASDYEDNVGSHMPTAFSVLGMVRAFTSGKISHFFGLNGPSLVFDTACSSSAVAIHTACTAIQTGECSLALAGGVNVITAPTLHQNLQAANFLSPTGASKAFDARADGYCRGEGAGIVLLKKLSCAVADNDQILGVIAGSAVNQNENSVPITVPVSSSQSSLYRRILSLGDMNPRQVSYVEAHGTGTPKGDPIECESIRQVFGGISDRPLPFGSVKGNIGHTEAASGVAALIKSLLMVQHGVIPKQASFETLNPNIGPLEPSNMRIPLETGPWNTVFKAACINNYGAAGSNAAILVCQPPNHSEPPVHTNPQALSASRYPVIISAQTPESVKAYAQALSKQLERRSFHLEPQESTLPDIAFNLGQKLNYSMPYSISVSVSSLKELCSSLDDVARGMIKTRASVNTKAVVLVFAGQSGRMISFSEEAYNGSHVLKHYLDKCNSTICTMGLNSIIPGIFSTEPVNDIVRLHCMIFSMQYSISMSWLECGLKVKCLIGHSFGQLTALCVAGSITLVDALKLIAGRASIIKSCWGHETGAMLSVNADLDTVGDLVKAIHRSEPSDSVEIACYNGPSDHVLVGSRDAIRTARRIISSSPGFGRARELEITHGFHSQFVDPMLPNFTALCQQVTFKQPLIHIETCSQGESWQEFTPQLVAQQSRDPVFFGEAIARIRETFGPCSWVEAGSNTPAIALVRRAIGEVDSKLHSFHSLKLGINDALGSLTDTITGLWNSDIRVQFWPFHSTQRRQYKIINLPPYQFAKNRHWLEYIDMHGAIEDGALSSEPKSRKPNLVSFLRYSNASKTQVEFAVDQSSEQYIALVSGHAVLGSTLCPASLYVEMMTRAVTLMKSKILPPNYSPIIEGLEIFAPLGICVKRKLSVSLGEIGGSTSVWDCVISSYIEDDASRPTKHGAARVTLSATDDSRAESKLARYERLVDLSRCAALMDDGDTECMQGSVVYKTFAKVVNYSTIFQGVKKISFKDREVAGTIVMTLPDSEGLRNHVTNPLAVDNFTQVAGLHVNSLDDCRDNEVFLCTKIDELQIDSAFLQYGHDSSRWTVYSKFTRKDDKEVVSDVFIFDPASQRLMMVILGVRFTKVLTSSLRKALSRANQAPSSLGSAAAAMEIDPALKTGSPKAKLAGVSKEQRLATAKEVIPDDIESKVKQLLHRVADVPSELINKQASMEELGIDSLMATELLSEAKDTLSIDISFDEFQSLTSFKSLCDYISAKKGNSLSSISSDTEDTLEVSSDDGRDTVVSTTSSEPMVEGPNSVLVTKLSMIVADHLDSSGIIAPETKLSDAGLDSLLGIELGSDIEKAFGIKVDMMQLDSDCTFGDLTKMVLPNQEPIKSKTQVSVAQADKTVKPRMGSPQSTPTPMLSRCQLLEPASDFVTIRSDYQRFAEETGWLDFRRNVYPQQAELVLAYITEAFARLGCSLNAFEAGRQLPRILYTPKHEKVIFLYYHVLEDAGLIRSEGHRHLRTDKPIKIESANTLHAALVQAFPQHSSELKLLHSTGSKLAECLSGEIDPIQILFRTKADRDLLEDVYTNSPMFKTGTLVLGNFLIKTFSKYRGTEKLRVLELGAGTGGTTKYIVDLLISHGINFIYTFTDISSSLVAAAKRKFANYTCLEYRVLDVEKAPPQDLLSSYHTTISSNCIHATKDILNATKNIRNMLRSDGFLCLLELTRDLYWLDCVFGLLEGWWLFEDGRKHVLADEHLWKRTLLDAGFRHIDWSNDASDESDQFRLIAGFVAEPGFPSDSNPAVMETVTFYKEGDISLDADIYYPRDIQYGTSKWPIALMIHGGGHIMLSRRDIRPKQTQLLLDNGLLPISVDYRLCPEITLTRGAIPDVCTALHWARTSLPSISLQRSDISPNGDKVVVIGWSTGGMLAMSLAWTAPQRGLQPPDAILAFYCPSDYEDAFWQQPNFPERTASMVPESYDILEGVQEHAITAYNVPTGKAVGGWMSTADPRSRIALHMNWKGQALPVLLHGLPPRSSLSADERLDRKWLSLPLPDQAAVASVSPYAHILAGDYLTPTYLIHGTRDDLIPWQHSDRIRDALLERGVPSGTTIVGGAIHLFDLYRDPDGANWRAVCEGYNFLLEQLGMEMH